MEVLKQGAIDDPRVGKGHCRPVRGSGSEAELRRESEGPAQFGKVRKRKEVGQNKGRSKNGSSASRGNGIY